MIKRWIDWYQARRQRTAQNEPLTITGRFFLIAAVICGYAVIDTSVIPLTSYVLALFAVAGIAGFVFRPNVECRFTQPELVCCGEQLTANLQLRNLSSHAGYDLTVQLPDLPAGWQLETNERFLSHLAPGQTETLSFRVTTTRRGIYPLPSVRVVSTFPFNLFKWGVRIEPNGRSVIAPAYNTNDVHAVITAMGLEIADHSGQRRTASSMEYVGSREFAPGSPVRRWDFATWARLGRPAVREFADGSDQRAMLIVDLERTASAGDEADERVEQLLSRAAATVAALDKQHAEIQLVLIGETIEQVGGTKGSALPRMLESLAGAQAANDIDWAAAEQQVVRPGNASVFAILARQDAARQKLLDSLGSGTHDVHVEVQGDTVDGSDSVE